MYKGNRRSETGIASCMLKFTCASMIIILTSPACAGMCNGVGGWTSGSDQNEIQTKIWNYENGHINAQTADSNDKSRSEYSYDWNKINAEERH